MKRHSKTQGSEKECSPASKVARERKLGEVEAETLRHIAGGPADQVHPLDPIEPDSAPQRSWPPSVHGKFKGFLR
ncbi:MAG TPA: hypothetical protein VNM90_20270 [Haliangium sp.]|nr:hypothetical protein [Haliangium sp.]